MMKSIALALTLLVACKSGESDKVEPAAPATGPTAQSTSPSAPQARPQPRLPDQQKQGDDRPAWRGRGERPNLDTNNDGTVSDDERAAARRQRLDGMRSHLDANGDGKLTVDELKAAQEQQAERGGGGRRGRMMRFDDPAALDTNKDGDISADELEAAMKARREEWQKRRDASGSDSNEAP